MLRLNLSVAPLAITALRCHNWSRITFSLATVIQQTSSAIYYANKNSTIHLVYI